MPAFFRLQLCWLAASFVFPTVGLVLASAGVGDPLLLSDIALPATLACWIGGLLTPWVLGGDASRQARRTGFVLLWSAIAIAFPLSWDLPWAILHHWVYGATAADASKWYFWAYAVADTRFLRSEPLMVIVEYWSGVIGVVEIVFLGLFLSNKLSAAVRFFIAAGCLQFYGTSVFFISEIARNLADIRPDAISYLKFFGLNGMWLVMPAASGFVLMQLLKDPGYDARATTRPLFGRAKPPILMDGRL
ncbi:hypothetical protein [Mycobacterium montefiorense]|uniref:hypothetical protein n=1 Tax=Mycobacterium montefiorense TaxID=154654 RepID=UPI0021DDD53C|nr:hypothetical protein [Mycobacterium montefiorense]MCV7425285.1 hypothetical protein [Mycobacterium montefiorense]GLE52251.1 hypothetical protein ATCCBAA256_18190 [Mycobacterium montefiorense]